MKYENPNIPNGINVGDEHPLKEFLLLAAGALAAIVLLVVVLALSAEYVARFIPFRVEQALAAKVPIGTSATEEEPTAGTADVQRYLEGLTTRLAAAAELPEGMTVTIHYVEDETVNAFATLGGHIFVFSGLLQRMPHENALAMVVAHEIAHVKHRDPIVALGRGLTIAVALTSLAGLTDSAILDGALNRAGTLTALKFSRAQEEAADASAVAALTRVYGHVHGAEALFEVLRDQSGAEPPAFFSTHPLSDDRIVKIQALAGDTPVPELTRLPDFESQHE